MDVFSRQKLRERASVYLNEIKLKKEDIHITICLSPVSFCDHLSLKTLSLCSLHAKYVCV